MCRMNSSHAGMQRSSLSVHSSTTSIRSFMNAIMINQIIPVAFFIDTVLRSSSEPGIEICTICTNEQYPVGERRAKCFRDCCYTGYNIHFPFLLSLSLIILLHTCYFAKWGIGMEQRRDSYKFGSLSPRFFLPETHLTEEPITA
jgi:hypothetical protein